VSKLGECRPNSVRGWKWGFRISAGTWCLAAAVFFNVYSSTLIGCLTTPKVKEYPQTLAAAVETGSLSYLITKNGYALEIIMVIS